MEQIKLGAWIRGLIEADELWKFYKSKEWLKVKERVLRENHYECYECKTHGVITRYDVAEDGSRTLISTVHHIMHVRRHPELALSRTYTHEGKEYINLIPVCKSCHNKLHPEKHKKSAANGKKFVNKERW